MTVQTAISYTPTVAIPGEVKGNDYASRTLAAEVVIQNGLMVSRTTGGDARCKLPTTAADLAAGSAYGIARSNVARDSSWPVPSTAGQYQIGDSIETIYRGLVWVTVETSVAPGDPVYVRHTPRLTNTQRGSFRNDADTAAYVDYATLIAGARFLTTATGGALALVDLNLPQ